MTVSGLFKEEPYLYDLMYDPRENLSNKEIESMVARHPNDIIYCLVQRIKELEFKHENKPDEEYDYISYEQMEIIKSKCKEELTLMTNPPYLLGCIHELYQEYIISEEQQMELYKYVDPDDNYNNIYKYYSQIDTNVLKKAIGY